MERVAIFVDAGYLFAQGSVALAGSRKRRSDVALDAPAALHEFRLVAEARAGHARLLRIYWYDGAAWNRPTADQAKIADLDDTKLRLGSINSAGEQKGVDSLIVTDLIELARQKAICDAVLMSGDEDVRAGVVIAQNYGVRVHLVGVAPCRANQSNALLQEVDTRTEWGPEIVRRMLSVRSAPVAATMAPQASPVAEAAGEPSPTFDPRLELAAKDFVDALEASDIDGILTYWKTDRGVPPEFDRRLLPVCRGAIGHDLDQPQKKFVRVRFQAFVKARS